MSLAITIQELRREVGRYAGFGADPAAFDPASALMVDDSIRNGLREFYFGFVDGQPHSWSFLKVFHTVPLSAGIAQYDVPAEFVRMASNLTIDGEDYPCREVPEDVVRTSGQKTTETGIPKYFAVLPNGSGGVDCQPLHKLQFYPVPNKVMTASFWYMRDPVIDFSGCNLFGGAAHAKTILQCCLAQAEITMNVESMGQGAGFHTSKAREMMVASIDADRRLQGLPDLQRQTAQQQGQSPRQQGQTSQQQG
jgi:hypothetical protein